MKINMRVRFFMARFCFGTGRTKRVLCFGSGSFEIRSFDSFENGRDEAGIVFSLSNKRNDRDGETKGGRRRKKAIRQRVSRGKEIGRNKN